MSTPPGHPEMDHRQETHTTLPAWFLAHGSPMLAIQDTACTRTLTSLGTGIPTLSAIVVIPAHWQTPGGVRVTSSPRPGTVHDFGGFDRSLYAISYLAPGAPALADEIAQLVAATGFDARPDPTRGLDYGVWVPLRWAFPKASVPVVQLSLPFPARPAEFFRVARALAPLRQRGALVVGSGGIVHKLGTVKPDEDDAPPPA